MPDQTELTNKNQTLSSKKSIQGWEGFELNGFSVINWIPVFTGMTLFSARPAGEQKDSI
jgi:hypothetical protein